MLTMHFYKTMHEHNTIDLDLDLEQRQTRQKDFETHGAVICAEMLLPMFYIDVCAICCFDVL